MRTTYRDSSGQLPSARTLAAAVPYADASALRAVFVAWAARDRSALLAMASPRVRAWEARHYSAPACDHLAIEVLNDLLGGYGVEGGTDQGNPGPHGYSYVNMGDTYTRTIVRIVRRGRTGWYLCSWGDLVEARIIPAHWS